MIFIVILSACADLFVLHAASRLLKKLPQQSTAALKAYLFFFLVMAIPAAASPTGTMAKRKPVPGLLVPLLEPLPIVTSLPPLLPPLLTGFLVVVTAPPVLPVLTVEPSKATVETI